MSEIKPTPGPWELWGHANPSQVISSPAGFVAQTLGNNDKANARLIAEAGTVHHETGLTPRQLAERVKELEGALGGITAMCEQHGDFRNGVTDPTGTIDEGNVVAGRVIRSARAALAKCEGVKP